MYYFNVTIYWARPKCGVGKAIQYVKGLGPKCNVLRHWIGPKV